MVLIPRVKMLWHVTAPVATLAWRVRRWAEGRPVQQTPYQAHDFGEDYERDLEDAERAAAALPSRRSFLGSASKVAAAMGVFGLGIDQLKPFVRRPADLLAPPAIPETPPVVAPLLAPAPVALTEADRREWRMFKRRFLAPEGRVVDTGNNCISHTEGQGWGMLFAVAFDDPESFARIFGWTQRTLRRASDSLHSWRYDPSAANRVADPNNASDGDIFIAWALWRAACRWNRPDYAEAARTIGRDILTLLVRQAGPRTVLLPGAEGFETADAVTVNPSYYCMPAFAELAEAVPSPVWERLRSDGLQLIADGRFGRWMLPPDWLSVSCATGKLTPASGWPARFSYDAVRVPLYLAWARESLPAVHQAFASYWAQGATPAWVDLRTGATAGYGAPPGMVAVAKIATTVARTSLPTGFPSIHTSPDYYSSALILLSRLAWHESRGA